MPCKREFIAGDDGPWMERRRRLGGFWTRWPGGVFATIPIMYIQQSRNGKEGETKRKPRRIELMDIETQRAPIWPILFGARSGWLWVGLVRVQKWNGWGTDVCCRDTKWRWVWWRWGLQNEIFASVFLLLKIIMVTEGDSHILGKRGEVPSAGVVQLSFSVNTAWDASQIRLVTIHNENVCLKYTVRKYLIGTKTSFFFS